MHTLVFFTHLLKLFFKGKMKMIKENNLLEKDIIQVIESVNFLKLFIM